MICTLLFSSCKVNKNTVQTVGKLTSSYDLTLLSAIPDSSAIVLEFNGKALLEKGALNAPERYKIWAGIEEKLKDTPAIYEIISSFLKDEYPFGLDISKVYLFSNIDEYGIFVVKLQDKSKFEAKLQTFEEMSIKDKGHYKSNKENSLLWNDKVLFVVAGDIKNPAELFDYSELKSIVTNTDFLKFEASQSDIRLWARYDKLFKLGYPLSSPNSLIDSLKNTYAHIKMNFEQGELKATVSMSSLSGKMFWDKYSLYNKSFNKNLLTTFPENSFFSMMFSINPKGYTDFLKAIIPAIYGQSADFPEKTTIIAQNDNLLDDTGIVVGIMNGYPEMEVDDDEDIMYDNYSGFYSKMIDTISAWAEYFGGDAVLNVYGFAQGMLPLPLVGINFTVRDKAVFEKLIAIPGWDIRKTDDYYYISESGLIEYFAYRDNIVMVTNDGDAIKKFVAGRTESKNLSTNYIARNPDNLASAMYFNLNFNSYPENIRLIVTEFLQSKMPPETANIFINLLDDIYIRGNKDNEGILSIKFKDKSKNSLLQILELIDKFAPSIP
ncbi:MAG: DUF4836 family protein [Prevotellaceae bacterium]|nr:DUF4836 family protein [Prevotellaceae bacterium]